MAEFQKAQKSELKALEHQQSVEFKELKASHAARQKEWELKENAARHRYFAAHPGGPERRSYVKDFLERRSAFQKMLQDELSGRKRDQDIRYRSLKEDQAAKLKDFQETLSSGKALDPKAWPH